MRRGRGRAAPRFRPVRPVVSNPTTQFFAGPPGTTPIVEAATLAAGDLFNVTYDTLLLMLLRSSRTPRSPKRSCNCSHEPHSA